MQILYNVWSINHPDHYVTFDYQSLIGKPSPFLSPLPKNNFKDPVLLYKFEWDQDLRGYRVCLRWNGKRPESVDVFIRWSFSLIGQDKKDTKLVSKTYHPSAKDAVADTYVPYVLTPRLFPLYAGDEEFQEVRLKHWRDVITYGHGLNFQSKTTRRWTREVLINMHGPICPHCGASITPHGLSGLPFRDKTNKSTMDTCVREYGNNFPVTNTSRLDPDEVYIACRTCTNKNLTFMDSTEHYNALYDRVLNNKAPVEERELEAPDMREFTL